MTADGVGLSRLRAGAPALIVDQSGKHFLINLKAGAEFHFHQGTVAHDAIIGQAPGSRLVTNLGRSIWVFPPRLSDYAMLMPRSSAIMYPKDISLLLLWGDIFQGARVLEAGAGSGALSLALLRAIGPEGRLVTCDVREDMLTSARRNVEGFAGKTPSWTLKAHDIYEGIPGGPFDRVVLDVPDPSRVVPHLLSGLVPGGIVCSYVPNVPQAQASVEAYRHSGFLIETETYELILRPWVFRGPVARPSHSVISHTGFLTFARKTASRPDEGVPLSNGD
ncbi:MAG TPA: tRNA (adenine-N1)-methyltransferase [Chloroflexota bacterium]|jgi:tRNA (adenine57-N1/adenine58-N1)-methyltransferase